MAAVLLVHKFYDDRFCTNRCVANLAGLSLQELYYLELTFLSVLDFSVDISQTEFEEFERGLISFVSQTPTQITQLEISSIHQRLLQTRSFLTDDVALYSCLPMSRLQSIFLQF